VEDDNIGCPEVSDALNLFMSGTASGKAWSSDQHSADIVLDKLSKYSSEKFPCTSEFSSIFSSAWPFS
jgi:hypothetical protein